MLSSASTGSAKPIWEDDTRENRRRLTLPKEVKNIFLNTNMHKRTTPQSSIHELNAQHIRPTMLPIMHPSACQHRQFVSQIGFPLNRKVILPFSSVYHEVTHFGSHNTHLPRPSQMGENRLPKRMLSTATLSLATFIATLCSLSSRHASCKALSFTPQIVHSVDSHGRTDCGPDEVQWA